MTTCKVSTKWDEVTLSISKRVPDEDVLEILFKKQLHFSEELESLEALYQQDTEQKGEPARYSRLKDGSPLCRAEQ